MRCQRLGRQVTSGSDPAGGSALHAPSNFQFDFYFCFSLEFILTFAPGRLQINSVRRFTVMEEPFKILSIYSLLFRKKVLTTIAEVKQIIVILFFPRSEKGH